MAVLVLIRTACMPKAELTLSAAALAALALPLLPPQPPGPQAAAGRQGDPLGLAQPGWVPGAALAEELVQYSPQVNTSILTDCYKPWTTGLNGRLPVCVCTELTKTCCRRRESGSGTCRIGNVKRHVPGSAFDEAALDSVVAYRCTWIQLRGRIVGSAAAACPSE